MLCLWLCGAFSLLCGAMSNVSSELIWSIVRDTSCHLLKRKLTGTCAVGKKGAEFTTEPNNVTGMNAWKYSGLANSKTIGLTAADSKGVVLTTKSRNGARIGKVRTRHRRVRCLVLWRHTGWLAPAQTLARLVAWVAQAARAGCSQRTRCHHH